MHTKMLFASLSAFALAGVSRAEVGVVEATGAFQLAGASSTSYVSAIGAGQNPRLDGYDFGSVDVLAGQSLLLQNWFFENYAYNGGSTPDGALTNNNWLDGSNIASLVVVIKAGSATISSNVYSLTQTGDSGSNRFWQLVAEAQNTDLAAGLTNGEYSIEFSNTFNANQWTGSVSQFNASTVTSTASFVVTPAPGAMALLGVAGLVGARRRR
jgi:hypothetical protein